MIYGKRKLIKQLDLKIFSVDGTTRIFVNENLTQRRKAYGAPCVKLRNIKFCIIFWLILVKLHAISYIVQFMYIAAICVNCCNLCILQKNLYIGF